MIQEWITENRPQDFGGVARENDIRQADCQMFLINSVQLCSLWHPLVDARLGEADEGHRMLHPLEHALVHLELVQVAASKKRAPLVGTVKPFD